MTEPTPLEKDALKEMVDGLWLLTVGAAWLPGAFLWWIKWAAHANRARPFGFGRDELASVFIGMLITVAVLAVAVAVVWMVFSKRRALEGIVFTVVTVGAMVLQIVWFVMGAFGPFFPGR